METKTKTERRQNCNYQEGTCDNYTTIIKKIIVAPLRPLNLCLLPEQVV